MIPPSTSLNAIDIQQPRNLLSNWAYFSIGPPLGAQNYYVSNKPVDFGFRGVVVT